MRGGSLQIFTTGFQAYSNLETIGAARFYQTAIAPVNLKVTIDPYAAVGDPIFTVDGRIRFSDLPAFSAGLSPGDVWNNAGALNIV